MSGTETPSPDNPQYRTLQEIREHQQHLAERRANGEPIDDLEPDAIGADENAESSSSRLSLPSISRKHLLILAVLVVGAIVVWRLRQSAIDADGEPIPVDEDDENENDTHPLPGRSDVAPSIEHDPTDPLSADNQALEILRSSGRMRLN